MLIRGLCAAGFIAVSVATSGWAAGTPTSASCDIDHSSNQACAVEGGEVVVASASVTGGLESLGILRGSEAAGNVPVPFSVMMLGTIIVGGVMFARRRREV